MKPKHAEITANRGKNAANAEINFPHSGTREFAKGFDFFRHTNLMYVNIERPCGYVSFLIVDLCIVHYFLPQTMFSGPCSCDLLKKLIVDDFLADPSPVRAVVSTSLVLGLLCLTKFALGLLKSTVKAVWPAKNLRKYGEWAVVTGATDGIGLGTDFTVIVRCSV